jgi:hypothetical protein
MTSGIVGPWGPWDGRPLYQYRWKDEDREAWAQRLRAKRPERWTASERAAFCLYVAEAWRLSYDRGPWSWAPFLAPLGQEEGRWVEEVVADGLRALQRPLRQDPTGRQYLATLLPEGGLPIRLLARPGSWLPSWLGAVVRAGLAKGLPREDPGWAILARGCADAVPIRLRHELTFQAGGDLAAALSWLGRELPERERRDPLRWLDAHRPGWREALPVPIDAEGARALVAPLLVGAEDPPRELRVARYLRLHPTPTLVASLDLPDPLPLRGAEQLITGQPPTWMIHLMVGPSELVAARLRQATDGYKVTHQRAWSGPEVAEEIGWAAAPSGGLRGIATPAPGGEPLGDLPWVFAPVDRDRARLLGEVVARSSGWRPGARRAGPRTWGFVSETVGFTWYQERPLSKTSAAVSG